jgi:hypothetical protein
MDNLKLQARRRRKQRRRAQFFLQSEWEQVINHSTSRRYPLRTMGRNLLNVQAAVNLKGSLQKGGWTQSLISRNHLRSVKNPRKRRRLHGLSPRVRRTLRKSMGRILRLIRKLE